MGRDNASGVAGTLDWAPGSWVRGKALASIVSGAGGLPGGNLLIGIPAGVVDWDSLERDNSFGVARTLGWAPGG